MTHPAYATLAAALASLDTTPAGLIIDTQDMRPVVAYAMTLSAAVNGNAMHLQSHGMTHAGWLRVGAATLEPLDAALCNHVADALEALAAPLPMGAPWERALDAAARSITAAYTVHLHG